MPLYKRKPFLLSEKPDDLKPEELVFQVRFTKEIFRDYGDYLKRVNLYRQRVWTCKITGKSNLTYEEALVSENRANEKVQQFPKELVEHVLRDVQFSMLTFKDLVSTIALKLQERFFEGTELYGRKNNRIYPCKIVKILEEDVDKTQYQVAWLDKDKKVTESAVLNGEDLIKKKMPFSRDVLKSFIRESTCRTAPWVLHEKLAQKYGISTVPPVELRDKILSSDGPKPNSRKRKKGEKYKPNNLETNKAELRDCKQKKVATDKSVALISEEKMGKDDKQKELPIKYPIDDLLVQPTADDPVFTNCPTPSRNFSIPMDCVGELLMVWNFCSSFGRLLNLSPFSLEHFENAICHKESNVVLIAECHSALLRLLIKDDGDYFLAVEKKKRKSKITLTTWKEYLCDFLEMMNKEELSGCIITIKRGYYGLLDVKKKLSIFRELVDMSLTTECMREKLDEFIEERQALGVTRREEALEEGRRKREAKDLAKKVESNGKVLLEGQSNESVGSHESEIVHRGNKGRKEMLKRKKRWACFQLN